MKIKTNILEAGHEAIYRSLDITRLHNRSYAQIKPAVRDLQDHLLSHLKYSKQDTFTELKDFFQKDHHALKILESLEFHAKNFRIQVFMFFEEFPADLRDQKPVNFWGKFQVFSQETVAYLNIEKEYLFPLLKAYNDQHND